MTWRRGYRKPLTIAEIAARFWAKVDRSAGGDGHWYWRGAHSRPSRPRSAPPRPVFWVGRLYVGTERASHEAAQWIVPAARMALALFDGVPLQDREGLEACHQPACSDPLCINPGHLYWGTPEQNRDDRYPQRRADMIAGLGEL